jgi:DNA-binding transcriptional MerR regulator
MMRIFNDMSIGILAKRTRCSVATIRYYEQIGLLPEATRRSGGHRVYRSADLSRVIFIRRCRDFGFPIEQVKELVGLAATPQQNCITVRDIAQQRLNEVQSKLKELRALQRSLAQFVEDCTAQCAGGPASNCVIMTDLAGPKQKSCCG